MALTPGTRLGVYEVTEQIGAGGMGEVYRAKDTQLGRDVALKILPDTFTHDTERVARFRREAQVLASLNHPHIGAIYGLDEANGQQFLVLELATGESLDRRVARGRIPVEEALDIALQIAEALEAAHEKGIVHRDLKPSNIALGGDGNVKVLDFGLAKVIDASGGSVDLSNSPTITSPAMMTGVGVILGTAAYMSPEQARGRPADRRSDVWAFGCVLYETLTATCAFEGETVSDTLANVLKSEPDWQKMPTDTPPSVRALIARCLVKDRKHRVGDLAVATFVLADPSTALTGATVATRPPLSRVAVVAMAVMATFILTATVIAARVWMTMRLPTITSFVVATSPGSEFIVNGRLAANAAIAPDGRRLVFTARDPTGRVLLWMRDIAALDAKPMEGTSDAAFPFWSPDSRFVAFFAGGRLMKIGVNGGPPQTICAVRANRGGTWNRDGVIVIGGQPGPLLRVAASGGETTPVTQLVNGQLDHRLPSFLPDGKHVLYFVSASSTQEVQVASIDGGPPKRITAADTGAIYSIAARKLLFIREGTLYAQPFDVTAFELSGEPAAVAEHVEASANFTSFSASDTGTLTYATGPDVSAKQMTWVDRSGHTLGTVGPPGNYHGVDLAPDGKRFAIHRHDGQGGDIWLVDARDGAATRFTFDPPGENSSPVWSPDGRRIAFGSHRSGKWAIYVRASNGGGSEERVYESDRVTLPSGWTPDGLNLVVGMVDPVTSDDTWKVAVDGGHDAMPVLHSAFAERHGQVSPDGRWIAYYSNESGRSSVYVQAFPSGGDKRQVSNEGGGWPRWRADGRELFFVNNVDMYAVDVEPGPPFRSGAPKLLFHDAYAGFTHGGANHPYSVSPDGQRFLVPRPIGDSTVRGIAIVVEWASAK